MKKLLLLAGIFTVLSYNAQARYYEQDGYYYEEKPRYERRARYREEPRYTRQESPRYRRISREEAREYEERRLTDTSSSTIRPYIGLDVTTTSMNFGNGSPEWPMQEMATEYFEDEYTSGNIVAGIRINKNIGIEAFYQVSSEEDTKGKDYGNIEGVDIEGEYTNTLSFKAYGIDIQGYAPITQDFELIASLGLAQYDFESKDKSSYSISAIDETFYTDKNKKDFDSMGIRLGIGGQYYLTKNLALRAMARYVHMADDEYIKSLTEFSLGLRYMF